MQRLKECVEWACGLALGLILQFGCLGAFATAQMPDIVHLDGTDFRLIDHTTSPFNPVEYGITTRAFGTYNWRGYRAEYRLVDGRLVLHHLRIYAADGIYPPIGSKVPCGLSAEPCEGAREYPDLGLALPFTGTLRLADGYLRGYSRIVGFQRPRAFTVVLDLVFEAGVLVQGIDRSADAAGARVHADAERAATGHRPSAMRAPQEWEVQPLPKPAESP